MNTQNDGKQRDTFKISIEEHAPFNGIASTAFVTSNDFLKMVSEIFKATFADYEGCVLETTQGGEPTVALLFNHGSYGENDTVACERAGGKTSGSSLLDRSRNRDRQLAEGDRYYITEDGKDAILPLLTSRSYNNGKPNWKLLVSEFTERTPQMIYGMGQVPQYTKISQLSLNRLCGLIFGTNVDGDHLEYKVDLSIPVSTYSTFNPQLNTNYMLNIMRVSSAEIEKVYSKLGFGPVMGTKIIR